MTDVGESASWSGSFERETFTVALGDLVRDIVPAVLRRADVRARYEAVRSDRVVARFDFDDWGKLEIVAVGAADRFVLHACHDEFELVAQAAFEGGAHFDALRIATFCGDMTVALIWCRELLTRIRKDPANNTSTIPRWASHLN
ncbi:MAG: hypothetical protein JKY37_09385 [Nannocystaceae bacterium]|nr:hypothetical protein [Nannocystaceae bacterium]